MDAIKWVQVKERTRVYCFPGGEMLTFEEVVRVEVRESGKHRIETAKGEKAFVNTGWLWMKIDAEEWTF